MISPSHASRSDRLRGGTKLYWLGQIPLFSIYLQVWRSLPAVLLKEQSVVFARILYMFRTKFINKKYNNLKKVLQYGINSRLIGEKFGMPPKNNDMLVTQQISLGTDTYWPLKTITCRLGGTLHTRGIGILHLAQPNGRVTSGGRIPKDDPISKVVTTFTLMNWWDSFTSLIENDVLWSILHCCNSFSTIFCYLHWNGNFSTVQRCCLRFQS